MTEQPTTRDRPVRDVPRERTRPRRTRGPRLPALLLLTGLVLGTVGGAPPVTSAVAATDPAPTVPAPTDPEPSPPPVAAPTQPPQPDRRARLRWGANRVATGGVSRPGASAPDRIAGLRRQPPPIRPAPAPAPVVPAPTPTPTPTPTPAPPAAPRPTAPPRQPPPGPAPTVSVTGPSYDAPGGTVPVIVTAWNAPASHREGLRVRASTGARVQCDAATWANPVRRSVSRRCYVTTTTAGAHTFTGVVTVAGRTVTGPGHRFVADGPRTPSMPLSEVRRIERCGSTGRDVWLTFDDGYATRAQLDRLLTALRTANARAQFFVVGSWARANPSMVRAITGAGHVVHNHTVGHLALSRLGDRAVLDQLRGGVRSSATPRLLRPPYGAGAFTARLSALARSQGYGLCRWTTDTRDWEGTSAALMAERVRYGDRTTAPVEAGGSILMHMNAPHTAAAVSGIVAAVRARGLRPVPLR